MSAPFPLHTARNGGSLTSSMGASNKGKSGNEMGPIFIMTYTTIYTKNILIRKKSCKFTALF
jgi:hypothetical protein